MASRFSALFKRLQTVVNRIDEEAQSKLLLYLSELSKQKLPLSKSLLNYHEALLFICAHPFGRQQLASAEKELNRITITLMKKSSQDLRKIQNTGLPFTSFVSSYSHNCLLWLSDSSECQLALLGQSGYSLNTVLGMTLPSLEQSYTTAGFSNKELLKALKVKPPNLLAFYLSQFKSLNHQPVFKDHFFEKLDLELKITPRNKSFSRTYNRIINKKIFYQINWIKHFDFQELINEQIPKPNVYTTKKQVEIVNSIKLAMTLNDRETDPTTYLDSASLKVYDLDRGLSVAIYGMVPNRQLPIESYVGFTLFKNGFPAAYGGSWVFGRRANFGINIFEAFRGGESGYMMSQILRVYKQVFQLSFFEIEPYQFGLDNPDGLDSGAFWFYYRYGFKPLAKDLKSLAHKEYKKIISSKSYRTPKTILKRFTADNLSLNLDKSPPVSLLSITNVITNMINQQYKGDRSQAVSRSVNAFKLKSTSLHLIHNEAANGLEDIALLANALKVSDKNSIDLLTSMVKLKPIDLYSYADALRQFLESREKK